MLKIIKKKLYNYKAISEIIFSYNVKELNNELKYNFVLIIRNKTNGF